MSFLFGKKVNTVTAAEKISQFQSTTCDFGTPLPYVFGTAKRGPNLINYQDFYAQPIVTKQKTGKRSSSTSIDYKYFAYIELALCEGIIDGIGKLWVGDKEYDSLSAFNATVNAQGAPLSLNAGDISAPTTYMSTNHPDIAVGYNQMAYLYGYVYLGMNNASIPSYAVEVQGLLRGAGNNGDGTDANPAAVINYMLNLMGYGSHVDSTSYAEYLQYCTQADLLISTPQDAFTSQKKIQEVVKELLTLTNTYMFWSVDKFKFVPRDTMTRGTWSPRTQNGPDLTPDEMMKQSNGACVMYERKDTSEVYNRFGVTFTSRANQYEAETVFYEDTTDVATNGIKSAPDVDGSWLHTVERAVTVAEMQARINRTENIKYTFRLPWSYAYLEPGDIVTLTDPEIGLDHQLVMIDSVTEQDDETLLLTALRREIATAATYNTGSDDYNIVDNNGDPGDVLAPIIFTPPPQLATSANIEVWVAVQGQTESWGGCQIYASTKDGDYELIGIHNKNSNYGKLLTAISASDTTVEVEFYNWWPVEIPEGSAQDAANGVTDIWIDGECCAYTASTLIGANQYRLTLVRGKYGSTAAAHAIDDEFALMDGNLFSMVLPSGYANKTLYAKFPSFNTIGSKTQDLADIGYYTFTTSAEGYTENYVEQELTGYAPTSDLDNYVAKTSPDYIKSASVTGNTLTLTKGNDTAVTFTPSGGGGGSYTAGDGIDITSDVISLKVASANDVGGVKVGSGLSIDANGVLSATGGGGGGETEYPNAGYHNSRYRGKSLGSSVTATQWASIDAGTFEDLFIGDYWTINNVNWRIAAFDYWLNTGDTGKICTTHHVVIVPDTCLVSNVKMNSSATANGGYAGSNYYTGNNSNTARATARTIINNAFTSSHILTHREALCNTISNGRPSDGAWYDSTFELMSEPMVYGTFYHGQMAYGGNEFYKFSNSRTILPLFLFEPSRAVISETWWLRNIKASNGFCRVASTGTTNRGDANNECGIRPVVGIRQASS